MRPDAPLEIASLPVPSPGPGEVLLRVGACGVCRTDLHQVDGELAPRGLPRIPGHQIVGEVVGRGPGVGSDLLGARVGVPWLARTCGSCPRCLAGRENLCAAAEFTGYTRDGGFAEYAVADARFVFPLPDAWSDIEAAPLLCAGLIGYRSLSKTGAAHRLGIYGFGAAAHLITQLATYQGRSVYAFTRSGDEAAQRLALEVGATWAGSSDDPPPERLEAAIVFAPVGALVPRALRDLEPGGTVVCGGIHMSDIPSFPYSDLWLERTITSVANLTRDDGREFLPLAARAGVRARVTRYELEAAPQALEDLRTGRLHGCAVLTPCPDEVSGAVVDAP